MLLPLQGVTNEHAFTQGVASLALGYALLPFQGACMIGAFITNALFTSQCLNVYKLPKARFLH